MPSNKVFGCEKITPNVEGIAPQFGGGIERGYLRGISWAGMNWARQRVNVRASARHVHRWGKPADCGWRILPGTFRKKKPGGRPNRKAEDEIRRFFITRRAGGDSEPLIRQEHFQRFGKK